MRKKRLLSLVLAIVLLFTQVTPIGFNGVFAAGVIGATHTYTASISKINKGGITYETLTNPGFAVSLAVPERLSIPLVSKDLNSVVERKIVDQFKSHIPKSFSSFFYFSGSSFRSSGEMGLSYYVPSTGEIIYTAQTNDEIQAKYRSYPTSKSTAPTALVSDDYIMYVLGTKRTTDVRLLLDKNGAGVPKWKELATSANGLSDTTADSLWKAFFSAPDTGVAVSTYLNDMEYIGTVEPNYTRTWYLLV